MASGTILYSDQNGVVLANGASISTQSGQWVRVDQGGAYCSGLIEHGESALCYQPATTAPGTPTAPDIIGVTTLQERDPFSFSMGTGESLWIKLVANSQVSVIVRNA